MSEPIQKTWSRIESLLQSKFPEIYSELNPPATDTELMMLRNATGGNPPKELIELYAVHNGAATYLSEYSFFIEIAVAVDDINALIEHLFNLREENITLESDKGINSSDYSVEDLPLFLIGIDNSYNQFLCVEYRQNEMEEAHGRVIFIDMESMRIINVASSISELLTAYCNDLRSGRYQLDKFGGTYLERVVP